mgnify:CR=1 FL=1
MKPLGEGEALHLHCHATQRRIRASWRVIQSSQPGSEHVLLRRARADLR